MRSGRAGRRLVLTRSHACPSSSSRGDPRTRACRPRLRYAGCWLLGGGAAASQGDELCGRRNGTGEGTRGISRAHHYYLLTGLPRHRSAPVRCPQLGAEGANRQAWRLALGARRLGRVRSCATRQRERQNLKSAVHMEALFLLRTPYLQYR